MVARCLATLLVLAEGQRSGSGFRTKLSIHSIAIRVSEVTGGLAGGGALAGDAAGAGRRGLCFRCKTLTHCLAIYCLK